MHFLLEKIVAIASVASLCDGRRHAVNFEMLSDLVLPSSDVVKINFHTGNPSPKCGCWTLCRHSADCSAVTVVAESDSRLSCQFTDSRHYDSTSDHFVVPQEASPVPGYPLTFVKRMCNKPGYVHIHPAGCFIVVEEGADFDGARTGCDSIDAKLASPSRVAQFSAVMEYLASPETKWPGSRNIWVDVEADGSGNGFLWADGTPLPTKVGNFPWLAGKPDNYNPDAPSRYCARFSTSNYELDDRECGTRYHYLCQIPPL